MMMSELRTLIVDDEPLAIRRLELALARMEGVVHAGSAGGCKEALAKYEAARADVVLLDVCMRDGDGFDFLNQLPDGAAPAVIFITAFDHFAVRAFDACAVDYVLKPVDSARLEAAFERARRMLAVNEANEKFAHLRSIIEQLRAEIHNSQKPPGEDIWVNGRFGACTRVPVNDIKFATSEGEYVRIHTADGSHMVRMSLRKLEERLDPADFIRTHRSAIVRVDAIVSFRNKSLGGAEVCLKNGFCAPLGRVYAKKMRAILLKGRQIARDELPRE